MKTKTLVEKVHKATAEEQKLIAQVLAAPKSIERSLSKVLSDFNHPMQVDGLRYRSRHDPDRICYGIFDRASSFVSEKNLGNLVDRHPQLLAEILEHYHYGLL
jgi:RES domain